VKFVAFFHFVEWHCISFGLHLCLKPVHVEIHVPFGFFKVGWIYKPKGTLVGQHLVEWRRFGLTP
jgi:hypothetical protein